LEGGKRVEGGGVGEGGGLKEIFFGFFNKIINREIFFFFFFLGRGGIWLV